MIEIEDGRHQWVIDGPAKHGLDRANGTYAELADHLDKPRGGSNRQVGPSGVRGQSRHPPVPPVPPDVPATPGRPGQAGGRPEEIAGLNTKAAAGQLVLVSKDEATFPLVPALTATLGVQGHQPVVGTWDGKHLLDVFAVINPVTAAVHVNWVDSPKDAKKKTGQGKTRRRQAAFAAHLRHVGRMDPPGKNQRVVILIDNAPWPAGETVRAAFAANAQMALRRLPSYSPQLNPIERFWRLLLRRVQTLIGGRTGERGASAGS